MRSLFDKLLALDEGNFLLTREASEEKLNIYKSSVAKSGAFDLHFFYNGFAVDEKEKAASLIPVDPELLLPYHLTLNRVPCLFEPVYDRDWSKKKEKDSPPNAGPHKKRNVKRKKKKGGQAV